MAKIYFTVNGIDVSDEVTYKSLLIQDILNSEPNTAEIILHDPANVPSIGQEIIIYNNSESNKLFAGIITEVDETSYYNEEKFNYKLRCSDYQEILKRRLAAVSYISKTCAYIINDLITTYFSSHNFTQENVSTGIIVEKIVFNYKSVLDCIQELAYLSGYNWYIDYDKDIHFFAKETKNAPFSIVKDELRYRNLTMTPSLEQVKNRIIVRGGTFLSPDTTETFTGDGSTEWILNYNPQNIRIYEDDVQNNSIGIENTLNPSSVDFLVNYKDKKIFCGDGHTVANGVQLDIIYNFDINIIVKVNDSNSQAQIAAIEGGNGIHEYVIYDKEIDSFELARETALAELDKSRAIEIYGSFNTYEDGWKSGQSFNINLSSRDRSGRFTVQKVTIEQLTSNEILYTIEFATVRIEIAEVIAELLKDRQKAILENIETVDQLEYFSDDVDIADTAKTILFSMPYRYAPSSKQGKYDYIVAS